MNILIFSWRGPGHPNAGGAEYVTHEHAKAWVRAGHKVTLFTSFFYKAKKREVVDGVEIIRSGGQSLGVKLAAFWWYLFEGNPRYDLVVDHFHGIPFFTPLYVRAGKLAFIHEATKNVWKLNPWPPPFNLIPYIFGTVFEPLVFKLFYTKVPFVTVSESTKKDLVSFGVPRKNITIIHNGIDFSCIPKKLPSKERKKTAIFLGAISYDKGIDDALKAFSLINQASKNWQFWIAGKASDEMYKYLIFNVKKLRLFENTKYWGFVDEKKKFELLARAHVLVNPSVREGWGLVNIEANAVGTPVVGYDVAGIRDSVKDGETGILLEKGDLVQLAEEVTNLVENKKKYKRYRKNCLKWARKFNWSAAVKQSIEFVERLGSIV